MPTQTYSAVDLFQHDLNDVTIELCQRHACLTNRYRAVDRSRELSKQAGVPIKAIEELAWGCGYNSIIHPGATLTSELENLSLNIHGIVKSLGLWIKESGIRKWTIITRLKRGMKPIDALTRADRAGNCLKIPDQKNLVHLIAEQRRRNSGVSRVSLGDAHWFGARIVTGTLVVYLGKFNDPNEATSAFNVAVEELPDEWSPNEKLPVDVNPYKELEHLIATKTMQIIQRVRSLDV